MKKVISLVLIGATISCIAPISTILKNQKGCSNCKEEIMEVKAMEVAVPKDTTTSIELQTEGEVVEVKNQEVYQGVGETEVKKLGEFTLTAYCSCEDCSGEWGAITSTGTVPKANRTIAVDPSVIPYGTHVLINGDEYVAEDCGGAIKGNRIDVYFDYHYEALEFGVQTATVFEILE